MLVNEGPSLTYDVLGHIIHCAKDDWDVLWLLVKTCKTLSVLCRKYIYHQITLSFAAAYEIDNAGTQSLPRFYNLVTHCPNMTSYVRSLVIHFRHKAIFSTPYLNLLAHIIPALTRLERLCLFELVSLPSSLLTVLHVALQRPSLRGMSISNSDIAIFDLFSGPSCLVSFSMGPNTGPGVPQSMSRQSPRIALTQLEWIEGEHTLSSSELRSLFMEQTSPFDISNLQTFKWDILRIRELGFLQSTQIILHIAKYSLQNLHLMCPAVLRKYLIFFGRFTCLIDDGWSLANGAGQSVPPLDLSSLYFLRSVTLMIPNYTENEDVGCSMDWVVNALRTTTRVESLTLKFSASIPAADIRIETDRLLPVLESYPRLRTFRVVCNDLESVERCWRQVQQEMSFILQRLVFDIFVGAEPWVCGMDGSRRRPVSQ